VRKGGRLARGWWKSSPSASEVREEGRESTVWLKDGPKESWVSEGGRLSTLWLNKSVKEREERAGGRLSTGRLNLPKEMRVSVGGRSARNFILREGGRVEMADVQEEERVRSTAEGGIDSGESTITFKGVILCIFSPLGILSIAIS
jgi:hypothetical protein